MQAGSINPFFDLAVHASPDAQHRLVNTRSAFENDTEYDRMFNMLVSSLYEMRPLNECLDVKRRICGRVRVMCG